MVQKTSPFIESKYGWNLGESNWNTGADENFLKFAFMLDNGVDGVVSSLPQTPVNGTSYYLTTDNRFYFVVDGTYYSAPCPKWFTFKLKVDGQKRIYDGSAVVTLPSDIDLSGSISAKKLSDASGSSLVGYKSEENNSVKRDVLSKIREELSILDFGVDVSSSIVLMGQSVGYVVIPKGSFTLNGNLKVIWPITFKRGASINVPTGTTLTINNVIESPKQYIFRGNGVFVLGHDSSVESGENARQIHASWFGAFPNPAIGTDQAPFVQAANNAVGNGREAEILFDIGNYNFDSEVLVSRGVKIKGAGQRRTVFKTQTDGFSLFTTNNIACRFESIQFELHLNRITTRTSPFITINHEMCDLYDIAMGNTYEGLVINAPRCRLDGLIAAFGSSLGTGSSLVRIKQADVTVKNVYCLTSSAFGPESVVLLDGDSSISNVLIDNIDTIMPSIPVKIRATSANVVNVRVTNIRHSGFAGAVPYALVQIVNDGVNKLQFIQVDGLYGTSYCEYNIVVENNSTGETSNITLDNVSVSGSQTAGIRVAKTSGILDTVLISSTVNVKGSTVPFLLTGAPSKVLIDPLAEQSALPAKCYDIASLADDASAMIDLRRSVFTGVVMITAGYQNYGTYAVRAASTPNVTTINQSANVAAVNTSLTGTTGVDGKLTLGVQNGMLYVENRLGNPQRVSVILLTGVP